MSHAFLASPAAFFPPAIFWMVIMATLWLFPPSHVPVPDRMSLTLWVTGVCGFVALAIRHGQKRSRLEHRRAHGLCLHCGYDLRKSPGRCPECGRGANDDGDRAAPAPQPYMTPWWRRAIGAPPATAAQKNLFGKGLILAPAGAPFAVVKRGRVFVGKNGSVKQVEGARAWLPGACACGGRAVRYCGRCGKEQPARRGGS